MVIESGRVRYTRRGYRCRRCMHNFRWDLTSPVFKCPDCGDIIKDKMAYYICRYGRGFGAAFAITWPLFVLELLFLPKTWPLISIVVLIPLTVIFIYKQMWSLIFSRILVRLLIIFVTIGIISMLLAWAVRALNIYKPDNYAVAALALIVSIVLTLASLIVVRINDKTYDYTEV